MTQAAKWFDPVIGLDIHMVMVPAPPSPSPIPTALPHPFFGVVFDPLGAAIGAGVGSVIGGPAGTVVGVIVGVAVGGPPVPNWLRPGRHQECWYDRAGMRQCRFI